MKVNLYISEPTDERFVRFLQSRPVAVTYGGMHAGFTHSVACWLYQTGSLTPKQENAVEGIIRKSGSAPNRCRRTSSIPEARST